MSALQRFLQFDDPDRLWLRGLRIQTRVIGALMLRDAVARFGHENLGFFWIIGEPMLLTAGVMLMWSITGSGHGAHVSVIPFALTGYSYITLWRHLVNRATRCLTRNASLMYLGYVKFFDILLSGFLLELVAILAAFSIVYLPLALLGFVPVLHDPLLMLGGWILGGWFMFGFSLVIAGISEFSDAAERFIQPAMYITLPFTGVFFLVEWLPPQGQKVMMWSPLVSGIEMFRGGIFPTDIPFHYDAFYLLGWCVALTSIGLPLCGYAQKHIQVR
ncbi:ABC transporter permease [uncultured Rhodoblastus sp.]|uniref:ABC transporter permease n=1 Tax=uncultured Rhodoblastus sp. TaxID=543037 RepID=UPI0025E95D6E|nr:ABC transporter permease [uncultured Rhodoblastus sp.]